MLKLRTIGICDYSVLEGDQRIGRIALGLLREGCVFPRHPALPMRTASNSVRTSAPRCPPDRQTNRASTRFRL
jgi:hypothetical protein